MSNYTKIIALTIGKKKGFRILLVAEIFLLLVGIVSLFGRNAIYEYSMEYVSKESDTPGYVVEFEDISLPKGVYQVRLHYTTDTDLMNLCTVEDISGAVGTVCTNGAKLFSGLTQTDFTMWLSSSSRIMVRVWYEGEGNLSVHGLTIEKTHAGNRIFLFKLLCLFVVINIVYLYLQYDRTYGISRKNKAVTFCLGLIILAASLPVMVDYVVGSGDLAYHLMRVEGIKDAWSGGQFPVRISPQWQQGYGYASPIFYGETLLYPAGLLRLIGFSVTSSYRIFMFAVSAATVLISYYSFKKIFGEPFIGVFCSSLYSLSIYRIYKTWQTSSWGECFAIMLLPILLYGFWRVFTQDIQEESYKRSWIPLTIGFSLLVQSHLLTGEIAGFFTILLCIILWKKVLRPQTFMVLAKTVIYSILLSAWFLVPFADYMLTGDFVIHHVSGRTIQDRGLYPAHLLFSWFIKGGNVIFETNGMADTAPMGVGIVLVTALLVLCWLCFAGKLESIKKSERNLAGIAAGFSVLAMLMSLSLFPWDRIQFLNRITATLVSSVQFPNRFLTIANVGLTAVAGFVAKFVLERREKILSLCWFAGMYLLLCIGSLHLTDNIMDTSPMLSIYNSEGMGTGYIAGAEYLPYGADPSLFMYHDPISTGDIEVSGYERRFLGAEAYIVNQGADMGETSFSLLYYKGYRARNAENGEVMNCRAGKNFEVTVDIPRGFAGRVQVYFESPWYWRGGEAVTLLSILCMASAAWKRRRKPGNPASGGESKEGSGTAIPVSHKESGR